MRKKPKALITRIKKLRREGNPYREVARSPGVYLGTSFKYGKDVRLSEKARFIISKKIGKIRNKFVDSYAKMKDVDINQNFNVQKTRIIGHCIFDGSVSHGIVKYTNSSRSLIEQFVDDVYKGYSVVPDRTEEVNGTNVSKYTVCYFYKKICDDLHRYTPSYSTASKKCIVPNKIMMASDRIKREFLRTFWEDEGCVTVGGEIIGRIKSEKVRDQLLSLHSQLGIRCSPYSCSDGLHGIYIKKTRGNPSKFDLEIGFRRSIIVRGKNVGVSKRELFKKLYPDSKLAFS